MHDTLLLFGATGDLAQRYLFPSLLRLHGACLTTVATAEGTRLQLELPVRGGAA